MAILKFDFNAQAIEQEPAANIPEIPTPSLITLQHIVDAMRKGMISKYNNINSDDTIIPVLEKNKTHNV